MSHLLLKSHPFARHQAGKELVTIRLTSWRLTNRPYQNETNCRRPWDSNLRPPAAKADALTTRLSGPVLRTFWCKFDLNRIVNMKFVHNLLAKIFMTVFVTSHHHYYLCLKNHKILKDFENASPRLNPLFYKP